MFDYLKLFAKRNLIPKRIVNFVLIVSFAGTVLINLFQVGRKIDTSLAYLQEVPKISRELAQLKNEKDATRDSLLMLRHEVRGNFNAMANRFTDVETRITSTNQSVKCEFKKMNDYFVILSSSNSEIKRLMTIKKETDNLLYDQMFPTNLSFNY